MVPVPNEIQEFSWEQISSQHRPACFYQSLWVIREDIYRVEELVVHAYLRMVMEDTTKPVESCSFPREHDKSRGAFGLPREMSQQTLSSVFGVGTFQVEVQISDACHGF